MLALTLSLLALVGAESRTLKLDPTFDFRLSTGAEYDSNAPRSITSGDAEGEGDALIRFLAEGGLLLSITNADRLSARYVLGTKRFFSRTTEDLVIHDVRLNTQHRLAPRWAVGAIGSWRQSRLRSGTRDYSQATGGGQLSFAPVRALTLAMGGSANAFTFATNERLSFVGPTAQASLTWRTSKSFTVFGAIDHSWRSFEGNAIVPVTVNDGGVPTTEYHPCDGTNGIGPPDCRSTARRDTVFAGSARATYRGSYVLGAEVSVRVQRSNSAFEDTDRFRLAAFATFPLPGELVLNLAAAVQLTTEVSLSQATLQYVPEDDENQNSVKVQIERPLFGPLRALIRYELFANEFATADVRFFRQTVFGGVSVQTDR